MQMLYPKTILATKNQERMPLTRSASWLYGIWLVKKELNLIKLAILISVHLSIKIITNEWKMKKLSGLELADYGAIVQIWKFFKN